jgi:Flp pilus assembly protein TadB
MVVHRPRTVRGYLYAVPIAIGTIAILAQLIVALSGPTVWILITVGCATSTLIYLWYRRAQRISDLAVADAPSFAAVVVRRHANEALELPHLVLGDR